MGCLNCNSCQNGGTCTVNSVKMVCSCPPDFLGDTCNILNPNGCGPGFGYSSSGNCTSCLPGTFSLSGFSCIPCQAGTASLQAAAASCTPCAIGQYSSSPESQTCTPCNANQCTTIGSITPSPSSPSKVAFNMTTLDSDGNPLVGASPFIDEWVYVGLFAGFVLVSGLLAFFFQKKLRRPVLAASVILRTPAAVLRVVHSSDTLVEVPSFFRGIVGIWASGCWVA